MSEDTADGPPNGYVDPFFSWAIGPGFDAYLMLAGKDAVVPVIFDTRGTTLEEIVDGSALAPAEPLIAKRWSRAICIPEIFQELLNILGKRPKDGSDQEEEGDGEDDEDEEDEPAVTGFIQLASVDRDMLAALRESKRVHAIGAAMRPPECEPPTAGKPVGFCTGKEGNSAPAPNALPGAVAARPPGGAPKNPVKAITAVIDDGIAFANDRFRNARTATRIEYLWVQEAPRDEKGAAGVEFDKAKIDTLLSDHLCAGQVEEDDLYAASGVLDYARRDAHALGYAATHGTSVMDLAGGAPSRDEVQDRPLIGVQLPVEAVRDTSLGKLEPWIYAALAYVLLRSLSVSRAQGKDILPVTINLSFGNTAGPHDGQSAFERVVDRLLRKWNRRIGPAALVLPSGNSHLARLHASFSLPYEQPGRPKTNLVPMPWRVLPDDKTPSSVEVWLPAVAKRRPEKRVQLRVVAPGADAAAATGWLPESGTSVEWPPNAAKPVCTVYYTFVPWSRRGVFTIYLHPTANFGSSPSGKPDVALAPSGLWYIEIETLRPEETLKIEAWVQRDDTPFSFVRLGRQSYFDASNYRRYGEDGRTVYTDDEGCIVKRDGSMNAIATGCEPIVVGGLVGATLRPAPYSAGGPVSTPSCRRQPPRTGPDVVTVSDESPVRLGVMSAGTRSGSVVALGGTSMASAKAAWELTADAQQGIDPDRQHARAIAQPLPSLPGERVGRGVIEAPPRYPTRSD